MNENAQWPAVSLEAEYLLGVGDELAFIQLNETTSKIEFAFDALDKTTTDKNQEPEDKVLETKRHCWQQRKYFIVRGGQY